MTELMMSSRVLRIILSVDWSLVYRWSLLCRVKDGRRGARLTPSPPPSPWVSNILQSLNQHDMIQNLLQPSTV